MRRAKPILTINFWQDKERKILLHGLDIKQDDTRLYAHLWTRDESNYHTVFAVSDEEDTISSWVKRII